ncbi:hypothetical protein RJ640_028420 [Escallonia rubra]|uniref:Bet v I/Major latex protein domain-containing protein n=1 Tax=Escallonia rubra TaxID=112253 RepID=A0AA88RNB5_9ASTE|nr:hypothetical protein RJ640_028420 [Escallonia rubra]
MKGELSQESEVKVGANMVWEVYGGLQLGKIVSDLLPDVVGTVEVVEGDGGVGTVVKLTFPPERFTRIDDEKRIKETELIEGGFKELGFLSFRVRLEILEKDAESSIIRSTVEYEVAEEHAANAAFVSTKPFGDMAVVVGNYLAAKSNAANNN